jgi:hypothetical protein
MGAGTMNMHRHISTWAVIAALESVQILCGTTTASANWTITRLNDETNRPASPADIGAWRPAISGTNVTWISGDIYESDWNIYLATYSECPAIPAPGAILLAALGAALVGGLRRSKAP